MKIKSGSKSPPRPNPEANVILVMNLQMQKPTNHILMEASNHHETH